VSPPRVIALALVATVASGCGGGDAPRPPDACLRGPAPLLAALRVAPAPVRLADGTPLSRCVDRARRDADLQTVGLELTVAAGRLAATAPTAAGAALRLGYLVGSAERGARRSNGIHAELVTRLENAATTVPAAMRASFARGLRAGRAGG